jgi:hypothetical protein
MNKEQKQPEVKTPITVLVSPHIKRLLQLAAVMNNKTLTTEAEYRLVESLKNERNNENGI